MPVETPADTPPADDLFGPAYLDAATFRQMAGLFGVGMAFCDYPDTDDGNLKLTQVLQAASRAIDAFCAKTFAPDDLTEQHALDLATRQFTVNNPPVVRIVS
ncbi:MAG: hypothetical protein JSS81_18140 [Acidobacteria bacterium]|nr:hypothetical protein [Acidobacteriota bacterium]